jgi:hypothetical protein
MTKEPHQHDDHAAPPGHVELPRPTVAPLVLTLGIALGGLGVATSPAFLVVGGVLLFIGLGMWIGQLLPGRGHLHEPLQAPALRPRPIEGRPGRVEAMRAGKPGYRFRLPEQVHPISAGVKGGIVGGIVMVAPAATYGLLSGHGIWYPANLLAGMVLPGVGEMSVAELEQLRPPLLALAIGIHITMSVIIGLIYGVLLPTLPPIPKPLALGGLLMPVLWTGVSFALLRSVNPQLFRGVDWPWFIFSQFLFGMTAAMVFIKTSGADPASATARRGDDSRSESTTYRPLRSGLFAGLVGGLWMPIPALVWGLISGRGIWYPLNLLAGMVLPGVDALPLADLEQFHGEWLLAAIGIHVAMSAGFGLLYGLLIPRLRPMPGPLAWGGLVMPMLWTGSSYGLMGVVNPVLQQKVEWPWFIVSQFVFGIVAAIVVLRSEMIYIAPAGRGDAANTDGTEP